MTSAFRMIVGVDGSDAGQRALNWAIADADRRNRAGQPATVTAVTAWQYAMLDESAAKAVWFQDEVVTAHQFQAAAIEVAARDYPTAIVERAVVQGDPVFALVKAASGADLLVLGSHGHGRLFTAVLGSCAQGCIRDVACPVVILPAARHASTNTAESVPAEMVG